MDINKIPAYELISTEKIEEVNSTGYLLSHKKTQARVVILENDDDNKVFDIGFRTPPTDSTGVPHIVEHTVLCGSEKFPVKDPFAELDKGSLNTFLNAMTYPDKTVYPVASVNDKDFKNLMDVYLDAVFFPNIYKEEKIFRQEGWHYEMDSVDGELRYNGVVFNEMKGAFSSPDEYFDTLLQKTIFPDNAYGVVSGGDPQIIPELKWEDYLDFHRKYYHPSNSYIYLYGDIDFEEKLNWIDSEYLSRFDYLEVDSEIRLQKPFEKMKKAEGCYPIASDDDPDGKTYLAYAAVCGDTLDPIRFQAFQILEYALVESVGAPVKEALVKAGIGTEIDGSYSEPFRQTFFSISAKSVPDDKIDDFMKIIRETLTGIVKEGINKRSLKAALNAMEFQVREADFGRYPKGLMYGLSLYDSWLYDDSKPFLHLHINDSFDYLRKNLDTGYFEGLIQTYLLDNPHSAFVILRAKPGMANEIDRKEKEKLKSCLDKLDNNEREEIVKQTAELKKYQEEPSTPEQLETIPMLGREDLGKEARPIVAEEKKLGDIKTIFNKVHSNGIAYIKFSFDIHDLEEYAPYIALLSDILGAMDTDEHDKLELSNELLLHSGGYSITTSTHAMIDSDEYLVRLNMKTKVLYHEVGTMMKLLTEIVGTTHLYDRERLKEIIAERRSMRQASMPAAGHMTAVNRAYAYIRDDARWMEEMKGICYYDFLKALDDDFEKYADNLVSVLTYLLKTIFNKERLLINLIADDEGYEVFEKEYAKFTDNLFGSGSDLNGKEVNDSAHVSGSPDASFSDRPAPAYRVAGITPNEGLLTPGNVQYVARAGDFKKHGIDYHGSFAVLKTILNYEHLWNEVRVKGGAYGVMSGFSRNGIGNMVSYRDPHLSGTNDIYEAVPGYLRSFDVSDKDMVKFIIGTVRSMDAPLTPVAEGTRSYEYYLTGMTFEKVQKSRDEVLGTTTEDIRRSADMIEAVLADGYICVVGTEDKIKEHGDMFDSIRPLAD